MNKMIGRHPTYCGRLIHNQNKLLFPALSYSNTFATIDNEAHNNTKTDYSLSHVLKLSY